MKNHRCTGRNWGTILILFLISLTASAQRAEQLLEAGNHHAAALAFAERGGRTDLFMAGEAWSAIDSFSLAREAYAAVAKGENADSLTGLAWHKTGVSYFNEYRDSDAAAAYRKAVKVRDAIYPAAHKDQAHSRRNLANCLTYLGKPDSAAHLLREAIDIFGEVRPTDSLNWLRSLNDLSQLSVEMRDYQTGVSASRRAMGLLELMPTVDDYDAYDTYYYAGSTFYTFRELTEARRAAARALTLADELPEAIQKGNALNLLGAISDQEGKADEKISYWERAIDYLTEREAGRAVVGLLHFNLARARGAAGEPVAAFRHVARARELLSDEAPEYLPRLASVAGNIHREQGEMNEALASFNDGLRLLAPYASGELAYPLPDSLGATELETAADLLGDRAETLASLGRPQAALQDYTLLFALQDQLRTRVSADESRRYLSRNLRPYFDRAIALLHQRHLEEPKAGHEWAALELSERGRAYTLLANLQKNREAMPRREAELRARIAGLERTTGNEELLAAARLQLDRLLQRQRQEVVTPTFAFDRTGLLDLLRTTQTDLLAFHLGQEDGYRFHLTSDGGIRFEPLRGVSDLASHVASWRSAIQEGAYRRKSLRPAAEQAELDAAFLREGQLLATRLFPEGAADTGDNICIIPDGSLALLPFGALPMDGEEQVAPLDYAALNYLQNEHHVRYAYSATVLLELARRPAGEYEHNLLAFAPSFGGEAEVEQVSRSVVMASRLGERALVGLQPLRFNQREVEDIAGIVPGAKTYLREGANRGAFLEGAGRGRIIHLSTHGMVNASDPKLSFVAFTQRGDSLELEELLYYNDLAALPLRTELAVLSACETSLGTYVPGETTLSLATAFTEAGARSTLTTLWQVDDAATRDLMVAFYRSLSAGRGRSDALALAQTEQRQSADFAHPYFWAAMTLYGEAGPIAFDPAPGTSFFLWGALTGFLLLGAYTLYWNGKRGGADAGAG